MFNIDVLVWVAHTGSYKNDIIEIMPVADNYSMVMLNTFFPVIIEMYIPCGENFKYIEGKKQFNCDTCLNTAICDKQKYGGGLVDENEELVHKFKSSINIDCFISAESKVLVEKQDKVKEERDLVLLRTKKNPQLKMTITEKSK